MEYGARIHQDEGSWLVEFPDCPGCQTFGDSEEHARQMASEALEGWLEANLIHGRVPPRPGKHRGTVPIAVRPQLALVLQVRWLRSERELTQGQLAAKAGITQQQVARFEDPDSNPTLGTIEALVRALGGSLSVTVIPTEVAKPTRKAAKPRAAARS